MRPVVRAVLLGIAGLPAAGLALAAFAPTGWWIPVLAGHWATHLAVLALPLWCWIGRRPLPGLVMLVLYAAALWPWFDAVQRKRAPQPGPTAVTVVSANLFYASRQHEAALAGLDGDIVVLIETSEADRERLKSDPRWPHQRWLRPQGYGGLALLSRFAMRSHELDTVPLAGIDARIDAPWGPIRVLAVHPWSPVSPTHNAHNQLQLTELAGLAATEPGPLLLLGDFNGTVGSHGIRNLLDAGLSLPADSEPASWHAALGPFGIAIDHAFVRSLAAGGLTPIALPGSDHRGIRLRVGPTTP